MFEIFMKNPHPKSANIEATFPMGIRSAFKRYAVTLRHAVDSGHTLDNKLTVSDLRAAVAHMHSLGLVHVCVDISLCSPS